MGIIMFSFRNWAAMADAVVEASSQETLLPASNLQTDILTQRHRTLQGATSYSIDIDFGQPRSVRLLALAQPQDAGYINKDGDAVGEFTATDTVRHRLDATTPGAGGAYDSTTIAGGWVKGYGQHIHILPAAVTARYWHIDINAPSLAALGYCDLGHIWAGDVLQPAINYSFNNQDGLIDTSTVSRNSRSGAVTVDPGVLIRSFAFGLDNLMESESRGTVKEMRRVIGIRGTLVCVPDPDSYVATETIIGRMKEVPPITQPNLIQSSSAFQILQNL